MKIELIDKLVKPLDDYINEKTELLPFAEDNGFVPIKIDRDNFHELNLFPSDKLLIAVDGGNANILESANFSVDFIRIAAVSYKGNKRTDKTIKEFFCFVKAMNDKDKIKYSVEIIGDNIFGEDIMLDSDIKTIDGEKYKIEIRSVSGVIRRLAELRFAKSVLENESYLVVDGSIRVKTEDELKLINELLNEADKKSSIIGFLSKTSRLLTKNASSLNSALSELGSKSSWYYHPVFEIKNSNYLGEMCFVKLNAKSSHVFKLEIAKNKDKEDYILSLSMNSRDPVFYGYPYCLVEADKLARVTEKEKEYLKTVFLSKIKNKERLGYLLADVDAHDILDNIS
jgi:hypothetical protein